jgi:hypothetical protein
METLGNKYYCSHCGWVTYTYINIALENCYNCFKGVYIKAIISGYFITLLPHCNAETIGE